MLLIHLRQATVSPLFHFLKVSEWYTYFGSLFRIPVFYPYPNAKSLVLPISLYFLFVVCNFYLFSFCTDPFEIQGIAGCELHSGGAILSFLRGALGGLDFLSFRNSSCVPAPEGGSRAQLACRLLRPYGDIVHIVKKLLYETCPQFLLGVLEAGKADLQRQS